MAEQFLNGSDIVALFEKVSCERMPEGVAAGVLGAAGLEHGGFHGTLEDGWVDVVTESLAGIGVDAQSWRGEHELPSPFSWSVWVFSGESIGERCAAEVSEQVAFEWIVDGFKMSFEGGDDWTWEHGDAVFLSFAGSDGDCSQIEVEVFNPEVDAFIEAETWAVEDAGHEEFRACEVCESVLDFGVGEDDGELLGASGPGELADIAQFDMEDLSIEEEDCAEGEVLGRAWAVEFFGDEGEELVDFRGAHKQGMFDFVEVDEACDPIGVRFGSFGAHMAQLGSGAELVEEFGFFGLGWWGFHGEAPENFCFAVKHAIMSADCVASYVVFALWCIILRI
jgi:hypothetical protein